ncbi:MAG: hypothetical protein ACE5JC_10020, partial [Candidatus Zixiibacteriota bacterium]
YNRQREVLGEDNFPQRLKIYDTTLRDGEQTTGVSFSKQEKIEIAKALDELGVDRIEVGMPVVSREDREAAEAIVKVGLRAETWGFCGMNKAHVDACADVGVKSVICEIATSPIKLSTWGWTQEGVLDRVVDTLLHAKERGLYTAIFSVDATRTDLDFLEQFYVRAVKEGKADEAVIVDTLGVATPETMYYLTKRLLQWVNVPVHIHCHNDFGLGTACTLASLKAGAECAHVCVNGLGERTGNADLAEVAMAASLLLGMETNIRPERLYDVSHMVERISGVGLSPLEPIVGRDILKKETGLAVAQVARHPPSVEPFAPELVGREREIVLSKKSGRASIEYMLGRMGVKATPEQVEAITVRVKEMGSQKRGPLDPQEFEGIVKEVV